MAADTITVAPDEMTSRPGYRVAYPGRDESAFHRATQPDYFGWLEHVKAAAGCSHPIRLAGEVATVDSATGQLLSRVVTADLPDGEIYKPCGNRRHAGCPSCAHTYQGDAYQLVRAGLAGGKGVPDTVAAHPAVFPTFTAPSFGLLHTRVVRRHTCGNRRRCDCRAEPCRPRRASDPAAGPCDHGLPVVCWARHEADDPRLGQPLCLDCYDHRAQVVWNHHAPELWRRTTIAITRTIRARARQLGLPRVEQVNNSGSCGWLPRCGCRSGRSPRCSVVAWCPTT